MSPLPPITESWDSDPDLVLPDGPLTLLHSDTEGEAETSSSSVSALFSTSGNHSAYSVGIDDESNPTDDWENQEKPLKSQPSSSSPQSSLFTHADQLEQEEIKQFRAPRRAENRRGSSKLQPDEDDEEDDDDDRKGGTLTLKTANSPGNRNLDCFNPSPTEPTFNSLLHPHPPSHPAEERDPLGESFSSTSSECQSTIKASFLPLPNSRSQPTNSYHYRPQKRSTPQIDRTVLAVLASGAKGTVTRLEPSKRPSPVQAGLDWDEDIELPEGGLQTLFRPISHSNADVKKQPSFASAISDELEDLHLGNHPSSSRSGSTSSPHTSQGATVARQASKSIVQCLTVNEEDGDFGDDFVLPPSGQTINLTDPKKKHYHSTSKPNSSVSLTGSEFDGLEDDPLDPPKSSASSRRGSVLMTALPQSSANSISHSTGNRGSIDDTTARIRTRPSLTPSLMSDRSSSSFPEIEDDINEGFFDDIEFPPEFGIPNNLAPTLSTPASTPSTATPKPGQSSLPDPKGKQPSRGRGIDLQNYLSTKVQARALLVERNTSSYLTQQLRQNISTFEDRDGERVEDGLEIETGSIHPAKLHSRKSSSFSSASSHAHQSSRNSYFQQLQGQKSKSKRVTVPFPSSTSTISSSQPSERHARFSSSRSPLNQNFSDNRPSPVPSSSTSALPGRPSSHASLTNRPNSAIPPGTSNSRLHALTPHRPISAAGIASGSKNAAYSSFANPSSSDSLPRFRAKSLRPSNSIADISHDPPSASGNSGTDSSTRVQSPLGNPSRASRMMSRVSAAGTLRARVSTLAACNGPPVLSASSQRTLKHKKSAAALKSVNLSSSGPQSCSVGDSSPALASPPGSRSSSKGRALHRKQSMPSLNRESHQSFGSGGLPTRLGGVAQSTMNAASIWKSNAVPQLKTRQLPPDCSFMPSSPNLISGSPVPSYADPTQASKNRHIGASGVNAGLNDRSISVNSRRTSTESARLTVCSPAPPMTANTPAVNSRLTMPTIASRLKAKPSIIHEEHSSTPKRWTTNAMPAVVPHQLRKPRRPRTYGDGTELDEFDDLPTSKEKEKLFTRAVKNNPNASRNPSKLGSVAQPNPNEKKDGLNQNQPIPVSQRSRSRLETRKAEGVRRRALAINAHIKKISTKKGLIRQMSGNTLSQISTNTEMRWNDQEARWEGNEHILREFDNVLSTSSRPALISQLSIQSPLMKSPTGVMRDMPESGMMSSFKANKAQNHVVGGMIFDAESMSWRKLGGGEEDEDELQLESDEELELRWLADDESSSRHKPMGGVRNDGWNSLSSSLSLPQHSHHKDESEDGNSQSAGTRNRGRRSGTFWLACVEAEERHKREISSWIPVDDHHHPEPNKASNKSSHLVKPKKSNASHISSHAPSSTTSVYPSNLSHKKSTTLTKVKPCSVVPGNHPHGRLNDADRCYLQEIRKLVLEEL